MKHLIRVSQGAVVHSAATARNTGATTPPLVIIVIGFFNVHYTTPRTNSFMSHPIYAIMAKSLA